MLYYSYNEYSLPLHNSLLDKTIISELIHSFWSKIFTQYSKNYLYIYIVIEYQDGVFKSLGKAAMVNINDLDSYLKNLLLHFDFKDDFYHQYKADRIILNYKLSGDEVKYDSDNKIMDNISVIHTPKKSEVINIPHQDIKGYNLPADTNFSSWGRIIDNGGNWFLIEYI